MAQHSPEDILIAQRYAQALFDVGRKAKKVKTIEKDINELHKIFSAGSLRIFTDKKTALDERKRLLESILEKTKFQKETKNTLFIMLESGRITLVGALIDAWYDIYDDHISRYHIKSVMAKEPSKKQAETIQKRLEEIFDGTVEVHYVVDEDVIGGISLEYQSIRIDNTIATTLEGLVQSMRGQGM